MQPDCVFCKIANKEIPTDLVEETQNLVVFKDINPKAEVHLLIVPKKHINDIREDKDGLWQAIGEMSVKLADKFKVKGFRIVHNAGDAALVKHMHAHFLGEVGSDRQI